MKMEIDLTEEQAKKVEILKEQGIGVGEAIDMLFEMKESLIETSNMALNSRIDKASQEKAELEEKLAKIDEELSLYDKLKDTTLDASQKQKIVEQVYIKRDDTYDMKVQDTKRKFKWSKSLFKF